MTENVLSPPALLDILACLLLKDVLLSEDVSVDVDG